jgi:hypothetical protein
MDDKKTQRTPQAEAKLRHAQAEFQRLAADPAACMEVFTHTVLPMLPQSKRPAALTAFRAFVHDPQRRLEFATWSYQGALQLYEEGALD